MKGNPAIWRLRLVATVAARWYVAAAPWLIGGLLVASAMVWWS